MSRSVNIPVRIVGRPEHQAPRRTEQTGTSAGVQPVGVPRTPERVRYERTSGVTSPEEQAATVQTTGDESTRTAPDAPDVVAENTESIGERRPGEQEAQQGELDRWRDRAMRLQADMDNYRKRQQRLAQDQIEAERQRLLGAFLNVVDDLERALAAPSAPGNGLRDGVELTHRMALQMLQKEGVEPIEAKDRPFDPNWHDAVATVAYNGGNATAETVVEVVEPGYRIGDRLLRPAKVIVAV